MTRDGFLIPNASDYAPDYQVSQPDRGDFVILGNAQYGVVSGCKVSLGSGGITIGGASGVPDILVVSGALRNLGTVPPLSIKNADSLNPRIDLVVYSLSSGPTILTGVASTNPVFPDIDTGVTVLAAVYVPPASSSSTTHVIDKRNFLQTTVNAVGADENVYLVSNKDTSGTTIFHIDGNGKVQWGSTSAIEQDSTAHLKVTGSVSVPDLAADTSITVDGNEVITENRISWGTTQPTVTPADKGRVFVNTNTGDVEVYRDTTGSGFSWIALETAVPPGTVIQSFVDPDTMAGYGWLILDGSSHDKTVAPNLWNFFPAWRDGDSVVLPNMTNRFPLGTSYGAGNVGDIHGTATSDGAVSITLLETNMPSHSHQTESNMRTSTETHSHTESLTTDEGEHNHGGATAGGGGHSHEIEDKMHQHSFLFSNVIATDFNDQGDSQLDNPINDTQHSYMTRPIPSTFFAYTGITGTKPVGTHTHSIPNSTKHHHSVSITDSGSHDHGLPTHSPKGGNTPFKVTPPSMHIYFYIKM